MSKSRRVNVAAAQLPGLPLASAAEALERVEQAVRQAGETDAELLILPECAYPAYWLGGADRYGAADILDSAAFVKRLCDLAKKCHVQLVCGFVEEADDKLFNSAVVIDAAGRELGRHRKLFLWGDDNIWFTPGECIVPIDTPIGRVGVVICADGRAPEIAAGHIAQGAELIVIPTCWVNVATTPGAYRNAQAEFMIQARAIESGVPIVAANKFGQETETLGYCGMSMILAADGETLAQAPPDESALIQAAVKLRSPARPDVPDWATRRIFSRYPPVVPDSDELDSVTVAVAPARTIDPTGDHAASAGILQDLAERGVHILGTHLADVDFADYVDIFGRSLDMAIIGYPYVERLMIERFGAFGCIASEHVSSFVPSRVMALDGASIVFVTGDMAPLPLLRTRAAENRVYVAAASAESAVLIHPNGDVIAAIDKAPAEPIVAEIDLRESANKLVFAGTDIWQQRRTRAFAGAFGIEAGYV